MNRVESTGTQSKLVESIRVACLLEATARKPGNVHPEAAFDDVCYQDFVASANAVAPVLGRSRELGVGRAVFEAVEQTRVAVGRNTNLGIILLLAPLAAVDENVSLSNGIADVLQRLTLDDAREVYKAIRLASPGGLGAAPREDVADEPTGTLLEVMKLAAERDRVAAQYATNFDLVLSFGVPILEGAESFAETWETAIIDLHLRLMAEFPDTLIARKCGKEEAERSAVMAGDVLTGRMKLEQFDEWLRERGNRRNPGTTADLVTACLFAAIRDGRIEPPAQKSIEIESLES